MRSGVEHATRCQARWHLRHCSALFPASPGQFPAPQGRPITDSTLHSSGAQRRVQREAGGHQATFLSQPQRVAGLRAVARLRRADADPRRDRAAGPDRRQGPRAGRRRGAGRGAVAGTGGSGSDATCPWGVDTPSRPKRRRGSPRQRAARRHVRPRGGRAAATALPSSTRTSTYIPGSSTRRRASQSLEPPQRPSYLDVMTSE